MAAVPIPVPMTIPVISIALALPVSFLVSFFVLNPPIILVRTMMVLSTATLTFSLLLAMMTPYAFILLLSFLVLGSMLPAATLPILVSIHIAMSIVTTRFPFLFLTFPLGIRRCY